MVAVLLWLLPIFSIQAAVITHSGTLTADETWAGTDIHVVTANTTVNAGVILTIEPGAIVKFNAALHLYVSGTLTAVGTSDNKITFTSYRDDSAGGDTNGDGVSGGAAGDWESIRFQSGSGGSRLEFTQVRYGGNGPNAAIRIDSSSPTIFNNTISDNLGNGIYANASYVNIQNNNISNNGGTGIQFDTFSVNSSSPTVKNNDISSNAWSGVVVVDPVTPLISGNNINNNSGYGIYYASGRGVPFLTDNIIQNNGISLRVPFSIVPVPGDGNVISGNTSNIIEVMGSGLSRDLTLTADHVYIFIQYDTHTVGQNSTLTLEPGVIVKFASSQWGLPGLNVYGNLVARGTGVDKIIFTSYKDDSVGGDTNGDGTETAAAAGDWGRLFIVGEGDAASLGYDADLEHAELRFGGASSNGVLYQSSNVAYTRLVNSRIFRANLHGLFIGHGSADIENNVIEDNNLSGIVLYPRSVYADDLHILIQNNVIRSNNHGIEVYSVHTPTIRGNTISNNLGWGIYHGNDGALPMFKDNTITGNLRGVVLPISSFPNPSDNNVLVPNQINGAWIRGGTRTSDLQLSQQTNSSQVLDSYELLGTVTIGGAALLTIDPGVILKFPSAIGLNVNGRLLATGDPGSPVVFTSNKDDSYGGDLNADGAATAPRNGDWSGITFNAAAPSASSLIRYAHIKYGSNGAAALDLGTEVFVENSVISNSSTNGIRINAASPLLTSNSIWGNYLSGVLVEGASNPTLKLNQISTNLTDGIIIQTGANALVNDNQIYMNRDLGLRNNGTATIDATNNWWGDFDASGPSPSGTGDGVSGNVTYTPYQNTVGTPLTYVNYSATAGSTNGSITTPTLIQGTLSDEWDTVELRPDRTMAHDTVSVNMNYSVLDPAKRYNLRASYFNGDVSDSLQSLTNGAGASIHDAMLVPAVGSEVNPPVQYQFSVPQSYYAAGTLDIKFVRDVSSASIRAALPELWLLEDINNTTAPRFEVVEFNDVDGSGDLSLGDEYYFRFSTAMDTTLVQDGTTHANTTLVPEGGLVYGDSNQVRWIDGDKTLVVTTTIGVSIGGTELVTATGLVDALANAVTGSQRLNLVDSVSPELTAIDWVDVDADTRLSTGDQYVFHFSEVMDVTSLVNGTTDANLYLSPGAGLSYGDVNTISWSVDQKSVTVTVTTGYTILGDEAITPNNGVTDVSGNGASGTQVLTGRDLAQPLITGIAYDDLDASGTLNEGDRYVFAFDEPMDTSSLVDNTTNANINLPPGAGSYGATNPIVWNTDATAVSVYITAGFSIVGNETVNPTSAVVDVAGNPIANTGTLNLTDVVAPEIALAQGSVASPVPPTTGYQAIVQFSGRVNTGVEPLVAIVSSGGPNPVVATGGTWSTTVYTNDTYTTPAITLSRDMIGPLRVDVSGAQDSATPTPNTMTAVVGAYEFYVQAAPGDVAINTIDGQGDGTSAVLGWALYDELANGNDIDHYTVYVSTATYTDAGSATLVATVPAGTKAYTATGLSRATTYYFAVTATDTLNNVDPTVTPTAVLTEDVIAPEDVTNLGVIPQATSLTINWAASADSHADLASYNLYFNGSLTPTSLLATATSHEETGLTAATAYPINITSVDSTGNESTGVTKDGVTLLPNPTGLAASPKDAIIDLTWTAATPAIYVKQYAVYLSTTDFTSVAGMTPVVVVDGALTSASVAGLTNGTPYFLAVTTINVSDGETQAVATVSATPVADTLGPVITNIAFAGVALIDGGTVTQPGLITLDANDPSGVSSVDFSLDSVPLGKDANGSSAYAMYWNLYDYTDAIHSLSMTAYDTKGNSSTTTLSVTVALSAPATPVITSPAGGFSTNQAQINVVGTADKQAQVSIYKDTTTLLAGPIDVDSTGKFDIGITLVEGDNLLQASAGNRGGASALTATLTVTLDTSVPEAPAGFRAQSKPGGLVELSWNSTADKRVKGYDLYRATSAFTTLAEAIKVNGALITSTGYQDIPAVDNTYTYGVVAVNGVVDADGLGTPSELSNQASAVVDSVLPQALSIDYVPTGNYDPVSGRIAPGQVNLTVTVSEPLLVTPFLSITPGGGLPMSVALTATSETVYTGSFDILTSTPGGTAFAVFSARDKVGNRGTDVLSGASIQIDTDGPAVTVLHVVPASPIKNDSADPVTVTFDATLNEAVKPGTEPQFSYLLSAAGRTSQLITNLVQTDTLIYRGSFTLPADGGQLAAENLSLELSTLDDLDNPGTGITAANQFQVYQGDLPPLDIPQNLQAEALPGGDVKLTWNAVADAADYQLYRQAPSEIDLTAYQRSGGLLEYVDITTVDGDYTYTVASVRSANGQEALSSQSASVTVNTDSLAPGAPENLTLELVGAGIKALWLEPTGNTEILTYNLYRAAGTSLTSVLGLTPIQTQIVADGSGTLGYIDTQPDQSEPTYAVTAVDEAGNESAPSTSAYLNVDLLPVSSLLVQQTDGGLPVLSWTHSSMSIAGYDVYIGATNPVKVNSSLLTLTSLTDTGYAGDARYYKVVAEDTGGVASIGRSVVLPPVTASLNADQLVKRGIMNRLDFSVVNHGLDPVTGMVLKVTLGTHEHTTTPFDLPANETLVVPVVLGGFADLLDVSDLNTTVEITASTGEQARIVSNTQLLVSDSVLVLGLESQDLVRGTNGQFRFTLDNTSDVETDIITALGSGTLASTEIRLQLVDADGNVLSNQPFKQTVDEKLVNLSSGTTVARLAPASRFVSDWFTVAIPSSAPDQVTARLIIDQFHHHFGQTDAVSIGGMSTRKDLTLTDTAYTGSVSSALPGSSYGDVDIVITGQALARDTGFAVAQVPLNLYISVNGFERTQALMTDTNGDYSYTFTPLFNEAGIYTVSALHPDELDRPGQAQFTINRVLIQPGGLNLYVPFDIIETVDAVKATTGDGTSATNLHLEYVITDQPGGVFPADITVTPGSAIDLLPNQSARLPFTIHALNTAAPTGQLVLRVLSNESGVDPLALVTIDYNFSVAQPALFFSPNLVETGAAHDSIVTETVVLENRGLADMADVNLALVNADGSPAPDWIYLVSAPEQGTLVVGEKRDVQLQVSPPGPPAVDAVAVGNYDFKLRITGSNIAQTDINLSVAVTLTGEGGVIMKVSDIYTATLDAGGIPIPGVSGAQIKVQNEDVTSIEETLLTDAGGEAWFTNLPTGRYRFRASAPDHQDEVGRFSIKAGINVIEEVFLDYNLITIEWSVTEITLEDSYQITLQATYETDVPAAVVVFSPTSITLPDMLPGDVFNGELILSNYGLIRADNLRFRPPASDPYFRYEFLADLPLSLESGETLIIPYRVVSLQSLDPTGTEGSGAGCTSYGNDVAAEYEYKCRNGTVTDGSTSTVFNTQIDNTCTSSGGGGGGGGGSTASAPVYYCSYCSLDLGGSSSSSPSPSTEIQGASCPAPCPGGCCDCAAGNKEGGKHE